MKVASRTVGRFGSFVLVSFLFAGSACSDDSSGGQKSVCGNGIQEPGEACDASDLGQTTCESLGFVGGILACGRDCAFDLSGCSSCGDGFVDEDEVCDGSNLGWRTCFSEAGLAQGTLVCNDDCRGVDSSGCYACGNGTVEGPEVCDGDTSCQDLGFDGGDARCGRDCLAADSSHCWTCEDGLCRHRDGETAAGCPRDCGFVQLAAGSSFACGLRADGSVWCWGANIYGELGDGTTQDSSTPVPVAGLEGVVSLSAGIDMVCAVTRSGGLWCWGHYCQRGALSIENTSFVPVEIPVTGQVSRVDVGDRFGCALMSDQTLQCWGPNGMGQLGDGTFEGRCTLAPVSGLSGVRDFSAGYGFACALDDSGGLWCWGDGSSGQLGETVRTQSPVPVRVSSLSSAVGISAGQHHACVLTDSGQVFCWGGNARGQLGDGTTASQTAPVPVVGLGSASVVRAASDYTCALDLSSRVWCWGADDAGQLGAGDEVMQALQSLTPVQVLDIENVTVLTAGLILTCAATEHGAVWCWGDNSRGGAGNGDPGQWESSPVQVADPWF